MTIGPVRRWYHRWAVVKKGKSMGGGYVIPDRVMYYTITHASAASVIVDAARTIGIDEAQALYSIQKL